MATKSRSKTLPTDPEEARKHLLAAAETCFEKYGITRTSMDDIAEMAGVSRPTLYRYFGDRDSLIRTIVDTRADRLVSKFHAFLARYDTLEDKLVEGLLFLADRGRKDQFVSVLMQPETLALANQLLMNEGGSSTVFAEKVWRPILEEARDAGVLRPGLDLDHAFYWLTSINFTLIGWLAIEGRPKEWQGAILRDFVVPGFVA
jgi:AcrR family transcriptional regulator